MPANSDKKPVVLLPNMGEGNVPDNELVKDSLEAIGVEAIVADLSYNGTLRNLPWDRIGVVDLRNMRGSLTNFTRYSYLLGRIEEEICEQSRSGHRISMVPGTASVNHLCSKAKYLPELIGCGIPTIPTEFIRRDYSDSPRLSYSSPNNVDGAVDSIIDHIAGSSRSTFVIKPAIGSLAKELHFIHKINKGQKGEISFRVETPMSGGETRKREYSAVGFRVFLETHIGSSYSPDDTFLLQEFVPNLETYAVYVNGKPHYVERTCSDAGIAHENYGGENRIVDNPDPAFLRFIRQVRSSLPEEVRNAPFIRIDAMLDLERTGDGKNVYLLSEIEGAGATRLFLEEAGRVDEYAKMLHDMAVANIRYDLASANEKPSARDGYDRDGDDVASHSFPPAHLKMCPG